MSDLKFWDLDYEEIEEMWEEDQPTYTFTIRCYCYNFNYVLNAKSADKENYNKCQYYLEFNYDSDTKEFDKYAELTYYTDNQGEIKIDKISGNELIEAIKYIKKYVDIENINNIDKVEWNEKIGKFIEDYKE